MWLRTKSNSWYLDGVDKYTPVCVPTFSYSRFFLSSSSLQSFRSAFLLSRRGMQDRRSGECPRQFSLGLVQGRTLEAEWAIVNLTRVAST